MVSVVDLIKERFQELTAIQKIAMPKIINNENVLILAPTGFGKTEAALLPVLEKIKQENLPGIAALYITPLRSLNRDLLKRFSWWCERLGVRYDLRHGDSTSSERAKQRKHPPQILLITCETLQALFLGKIMRQHLANVEFVIVDEVHELLENKRGTQLSLGLERLEEITKKKFQRIGLTATVGNEEEAAKLIFGSRDYVIAETGKNRKMNIEIKNYEKQEERIEEIKKLAEANKTLIFVNTRSTAEELGASMKKKGVAIEVHHGSLSKEIRIAAEERFKNNEINSLIATSSLELGIDIGDINLALQYGSPHQVSRLVQRVGRSGHALDKTPHGIIFPIDFDDLLESEVIALLAKNGWIEQRRVERGALDVIAHQLVGLCFDKGRIDLKTAHAIFSRSYAYNISFQKLRRIALQLHGEGLLYYDELEDRENARIKNKPRAREYYCSNLTTIPKERRYLLREVSSNKIIASLDERFVMNLENNSSFLSKGQPWMVVDITDREVLVEPSSALDIVIPSWAGEEIPVEFEVAQRVGQLRKAYKEKCEFIPDDKTIVIEIVSDLVIIHACFGNKVNEGLGRIISHQISHLIGESVGVVTDAYRIMLKLPFPLDEKYILKIFKELKNPRARLNDSLENSFLLKLKFTHVARLFGLFDENANATQRFIEMLRNSVVYEEAIRSLYFRYFDIERLEKIIEEIEQNKIRIVVNKRKELSFYGKLGIDRIASGEAIGGFEPREAMISALKEKVLTTTLEMKCMNCKATRFLNIAGVRENDPIKCHKCGEQALTIVNKRKNDAEQEKYISALIRNYGKRALIALATYGIGPETAARVLKKLHPDENQFYLELLDAQKNFIKNKKYWRFD